MTGWTVNALEHPIEAVVLDAHKAVIQALIILPNQSHTFVTYSFETLQVKEKA